MNNKGLYFNDYKVLKSQIATLKKIGKVGMNNFANIEMPIKFLKFYVEDL